MTSSLNSIARNPLSLYLRFVCEATRNVFRYKDFRQGYMSRVFGCEIEPHVRIFPESFVSNCRIGRFTYVAEQTKITHADIGQFCSIGPGCRIGLGMHPARGFVSTSPVFFSTAGQTGSTFVTEDRFRESSRIVIGNDVWIGANATIVDGVASSPVVCEGSQSVRYCGPFKVVTCIRTCLNAADLSDSTRSGQVP